MKKFKFRLETLLKLKQTEEDRKKRAVGTLVAEINRHQEEALQLGQVLHKEGRMLKEQHKAGTIDLQRVSHYRSYVSSVHQAIGKRLDSIAGIQGNLSKARSELRAAATETKTLETIKERQAKRYNRRLQKLEVAGQDEISANQYRHNRACEKSRPEN